MRDGGRRAKVRGSLHRFADRALLPGRSEDDPQLGRPRSDFPLPNPGRHLRFRRPHVLDFLRKYGYPIPEELEADRPRVALFVDGMRGKDRVLATLRTAFEVVDYPEPLTGLLQIGEQPPDAVVLGAEVGHLSRRGDHRSAQTRQQHPARPRGLAGRGEADRQAALDAGASAHVSASDLTGLRDTLEALMGVRH